MITRGHYLGEIIDELSTIATQVKLRNTLGLTDLSVYAENFFKDVLNVLLGLNLTNLNENRANEPGLDLGDEGKSFAFQVTSTATADKVNKTLGKITDQQAQKYKKIVVLVIGKRKLSYTLNPKLAAKLGFTVDDIWDIDSLARQAISLEIDALQTLHRTVRSNVARLRVELELPDEDGKYPTSGFDHWEKQVKPEIGTGSRFIKFFESEYEVELDEENKLEISKALNILGKNLSNLPRITREFLAILYERREHGRSKRCQDDMAVHLLLSKVERTYLGGDLHGELAILDHAGFAHKDDDDPYEYGPPEIFLTVSKNEDLQAGFANFVEKNKLSFRTVIGAVDLSAF